jgi:5'-3' exonuclease
MEEMIDNTLAETGADEFSIFLSGPTNFRNEIYPEYKANRKAEKPRHLLACKDFLIEKYKAEVSDGCEADDLLGIAQCSSTNTIICGLDKDLLMIPGKHYSFAIGGKITRGANAGQTWERPARFDNVEPFDGLRRFYKQVLTGDSTDNIKGASGIGEVKADRILADCTTERELFEAVSSYFSSEEELLMTGQCIWIWRKPNDRWRIPKFE